MLSSADLHVGDFNFREILAVSGVAAIAGAAREPEDPNLLTLAVPHDLGRDLRALHLRRASLDVLAVARYEDVVERDLVSRLRVEQRHLDGDSGLGAELSPTGGENGVCHRGRNVNRDNRLLKVVDVGAKHAAPLPITPRRIARFHPPRRAEPSPGTHPTASS